MDVEKIREDFPCLIKTSSKKSIIYLDNTTMTLTPKPIIDAMVEYYSTPGNLHSAHELSVRTMIKCDESRKKIGSLINTKSSNEIIWTKNATEGINLVSKTLDLNPGDIILTTDKEHNSNLIPWQNLKADGVVHKIVKSRPDNIFDLNLFEKLLGENVRLVSLAHTSIIDGYTIPAKEIIRLSHENGALVLLDGVLSVPHQRIDVKELDVDFLVFSLNNMCGPNGLGVLYGKEELLEKLKPFLSGAGANTNISYQSSDFQGPPAKFEAGNLNCASIIGAGVAVDYLQSIGQDNIRNHECMLNKLMTEELDELNNLSILGPADPNLRGGVLNFFVKDVNPHDIAISIEELGNILVRSGTLCAHSWFKEHLKDGVLSISFYIYNTPDEVDIFMECLKKLLKEF